MRNNTYVRLTCFFLPGREFTVPLAQVAQNAKATGVLEGRLLADVRCRDDIRLRADARNGNPIHEDLTIAKVLRLEGGYALTENFLVQVLRIPAPGPKSAAPAPEQKTVISRSHYDKLSDRLFAQMAELEAPIVQAQAICRLHEAQLARMRIDVIDPQTREAITAHDMHADFSLLLEGLRYYYFEDKERDKRTTNLWLAGHRVQAALATAIAYEPAFLQETASLALFSDVYAKLGRLFTAMSHISTFKAEEGECGAS